MAASDTDLKTPPPRSRRVPKRMTLREFEGFERVRPNEKWELIEGAPFMAPSAAAPHNKLAQVIATYLEGMLSDAAGWFVTMDTSVRFGAQSSEVRPDVAAYRKQDIPDVAEVPLRATPRLVVECQSPGNAHFDLNEKKTLYEKAAVPEYWVVDPKTGAISLFVLKKRAYDQLVVDPKGFIRSPLVKKNIRIVVKPWSFEVLEAK
jgi:Uma2 family endonuclease